MSSSSRAQCTLIGLLPDAASRCPFDRSGRDDEGAVDAGDGEVERKRLVVPVDRHLPSRVRARSIRERR
jgi:hypothetical protein